MGKKLTLLICLLTFRGFITEAQVQKLDGVYVGAQLYSTPYNGMQIDNIVVYFRSDGTFTDQLDSPDWKTKVSGKYTIQSNTVLFTNKDGTKKYLLGKNGNLESTSGIKHTLHKVKNISALPASSYESKSAASSGGMGTGMPNVAHFSSNYLHFDGKGHFSSDRSSVVGIGGDVAGGTIGGKSSSQNQTAGTYKLVPGEITLNYYNGKTARHSFFYSPPNEEDLIVMDGTFYFREEGEQGTGTRNTATAAIESAGTAASAGMPSPGTILNKLRQAGGGAQIDKIKTIKETSAITGNLEAVTITDVINSRLRIEISQKGKLLLVKQLEGNDGWQWMSGVKKPLTLNDKTEMTLSFYQGILGLHQQFNTHLAEATVTGTKDDYMLTFFINKNKVIYMVDADYQLKANAYSINGVPNYSVYRDFVKSNGITYPSVTESSDGKNTIIVTTTDIEFNPVLAEAIWDKP